jgi:hypothetical protein
MGLFDRLLGNRSSSVKIAGQSSKAAPKQEQGSYFLDPDASSSLGDVNFMRRSNEIRRTFPGNADSPGGKELVVEVASMEARVEKATPGLGGASTDSEVNVSLTGGVPKPVKKTFAQQMSQAELDQRMKGSAVAVNAAQTAGPARKVKEEGDGTAQPGISQQGSRPGAIDAFKSMAKELNG